MLAVTGADGILACFRGAAEARYFNHGPRLAKRDGLGERDTGSLVR
jgi:hypothetical protein